MKNNQKTKNLGFPGSWGILRDSFARRTGKRETKTKKRIPCFLSVLSRFPLFSSCPFLFFSFFVFFCCVESSESKPKQQEKTRSKQKEKRKTKQKKEMREGKIKKKKQTGPPRRENGNIKEILTLEKVDLKNLPKTLHSAERRHW